MEFVTDEKVHTSGCGLSPPQIVIGGFHFKIDTLRLPSDARSMWLRLRSLSSYLPSSSAILFGFAWLSSSSMHHSSPPVHAVYPPVPSLAAGTPSTPVRVAAVPTPLSKQLHPSDLPPEPLFTPVLFFDNCSLLYYLNKENTSYSFKFPVSVKVNLET